jgi:hypothetical protein
MEIEMTTQTVDLTPTWQGILPALLNLLQSDNPKSRQLAESELRRMAGLADGYIESLKAGLTSTQ